MGWGCRLITWFMRALAYTQKDPLSATRRSWEADTSKELMKKEWEGVLLHPRKFNTRRRGRVGCLGFLLQTGYAADVSGCMIQDNFKYICS
ncbi:hypothetical protein NDU88_004665 [Pleurodeles waltl]|uniref:Uncharacterized protein n=1 Tax=Pleurodeles waltl TaxID=8319 RepID=A0AAV7NMX6_PLEWA|nr:hypothetical protein NDU88_004665 [Pleurodeles waltl]